MFPIQSTKAVREVPFRIKSVFNLFPIFFTGGTHVDRLKDLIDAVTYFVHNRCYGCSSSLKSGMQSPKGIAGH